jgi:hypothetical protein
LLGARETPPGQAAKAAEIRPTIQKSRRHWRPAAGPGKLIVYEQHSSSPGLLQNSRSLGAGEVLIAVPEPETLQMWPYGYKARLFTKQLNLQGMRFGPHRRAARIAGCRLNPYPRGRALGYHGAGYRLWLSRGGHTQLRNADRWKHWSVSKKVLLTTILESIAVPTPKCVARVCVRKGNPPQTRRVSQSPFIF